MHYFFNALLYSSNFFSTNSCIAITIKILKSSYNLLLQITVTQQKKIFFFNFTLMFILLDNKKNTTLIAIYKSVSLEIYQQLFLSNN